MKNAQAVHMVIESILDNGPTVCRTCKGTPKVRTYVMSPRGGVKMLAACHGASESREIPEAVFLIEDYEAAVDAVAAPWFLSTVVEYRRPGPYAPRYPAHPRSLRRVAR